MKLRLTFPLLFPTAAISLLLLAVGFVTAWYVRTMQQRLSQSLQVTLSSMWAAEELEIVTREMRTQVHHFLRTEKKITSTPSTCYVRKSIVG